MKTLYSIAQIRQELGRPALQDTLDSGQLSVRAYCIEASDAATRAAHLLGINAIREIISGRHVITSFGPLNQAPAPSDPIFCMTWRQFGVLPSPTEDEPPTVHEAFFGTRAEIIDLLPQEARSAFSHERVHWRQVLHRPDLDAADGTHQWLYTAPADLATGRYQIGMEYPPGLRGMWG